MRRFIADPVGTHWYHTHTGTHRTEGAHGPLIVLDRSKDEENKRRVRNRNDIPGIMDLRIR